MWTFVLSNHQICLQESNCITKALKPVLSASDHKNINTSHRPAAAIACSNPRQINNTSKNNTKCNPFNTLIESVRKLTAHKWRINKQRQGESILVLSNTNKTPMPQPDGALSPFLPESWWRRKRKATKRHHSSLLPCARRLTADLWSYCSFQEPHRRPQSL